MAECSILIGGTGVGSEDCSADASKVLAPYTAITKDSDGEAVKGTMRDNGEQSGNLDCGQRKIIQAGYTSGGVVRANSLESQTGANAEADHLANGKTAWVNGKKITGKLLERGQYQYGGVAWCSTYFAINALPEGIYRKGGADWAPEARCTAEQIRNVLGITENKIITGQSIAGVNGNQHPYGYIVGDVTSDTSAAFYDSSNFYMCRFNLPFEPMVGYVIHYHSSNRLRDITVFAPDNRGAKFARMMNFNQAKMGGNYSYGFAQGERGAQCGKGDCIIPVAYGGSVYQYFFAGHY